MGSVADLPNAVPSLIEAARAYPITEGHAGIIKFLLGRPVDINARHKGKTAQDYILDGAKKHQQFQSKYVEDAQEKLAMTPTVYDDVIGLLTKAGAATAAQLDEKTPQPKNRTAFSMLKGKIDLSTTFKGPVIIKQLPPNYPQNNSGLS